MIPRIEEDWLFVREMKGESDNRVRMFLHHKFRQAPVSLWGTDVPGFKILLHLIMVYQV